MAVISFYGGPGGKRNRTPSEEYAQDCVIGFPLVLGRRADPPVECSGLGDGNPYHGTGELELMKEADTMGDFGAEIFGDRLTHIGEGSSDP